MNHSKKYIGLIIGIGLFITIIFSTSYIINVPTFTKNQNFNEKIMYPEPKSSYTKVNPIIINNDNDFETLKNTASYCTGNGSADNPYRIKGIQIDAGGSGYCISIKNTRVYFVIEDSYILNSGNYKAGIYLYNVVNGTIKNNTLSSNGCGIDIVNSSKNVIVNNTFIRNKIGLRIDFGYFSNGNPRICKDNLIYDNYFLYSTLDQIQDKTGLANNKLFESSIKRGNYWSNLHRTYLGENFTRIINNQNVSFYICQPNQNFTFSNNPLNYDKYPLTANDTDKDGLDDILEALLWRTNISLYDTDGDSMWDGWEVSNGFDPLNPGDKTEDADDDGLENYIEFRDTYPNEKKFYEKTDPNDADTDNDGWEDGKEVEEGTSPTNPFDHPDFENVENVQISFGLYFLISLTISAVCLIFTIKHKLKALK
ncbi:MAG: NosD domain-containing protein [Promethearchaeota archaeon]